MNGRVICRAVQGVVRTGRGLGRVALCAALFGMSTVAVAPAQEPLVVISPQTSGSTTICDTGCVTCTVVSGECVLAGEEDLVLCRPTSTGLPITACDWSLFLDGSSPGLSLDFQIRAADVAPNGNIAFVTLNDSTIPGVGPLAKEDIGILNPSDVLKPFVGGGPYDAGTFKLYLNGDLTQQDEVSTKPWDALKVLPAGGCESSITAIGTAPHACPIIGSLTGGSGGPGLDGVHFENEDLLRCIPDGFALNGTVESCSFSMFLESDQLNGGGAAGIASDVEAIDFLSFDGATMSGEMVFKKGSGAPTGFPVHNPGKDLLLYDGTFGNGLCVPSGNLCASVDDCLNTDTSCNTGSCVIGGAPCASDDDCASGTCTRTRTPAGTVTKFFDGVAVGLTGSGQNIEGFTLLPEGDGDGIPSGVDNCPTVANPPSVCSGAGPETCPGGLSSECPVSEVCEQSDDDGDGVGDACDQCNGRDDAVCACGDGILDLPSEQCDLGGSNGPPSPCSLTCTIAGSCKGSGTPCTVTADCPSGQGCCGNDIVEANEGCDDGNDIENDPCFATCDGNALGTPILGCEDLTGPNIIPASIKVTKFNDKPTPADFDRWKTKGEFIFTQGLTIDPDTQPVKIIYNNNTSGLLFQSTLDPGDCIPTPCFVQGGSVAKPKWKFKDKEADLAGAPSWRKGKLTIKNNKGVFTLDGRNTTLFTLAEAGVPPGARQTVRIGDVCVTGVVQCLASGSGKALKCSLVP